MGIERQLTKIEYSGNTDAAKGHLYDGLLVLHKVREQISLSPTNIQTYKLRRELFDGSVIEVLSAGGRESIHIFSPIINKGITQAQVPEKETVFGFICHPRSDKYPGGRTAAGIAISGAYTYPLIDNDHGSVVLIPPNWTMSYATENYGNIDWSGPSIIGGSNVLTFRGPAGRQLGLDPTIDYPGFTFLDETLGDLNPINYYTPFSSNIYRAGGILKVNPAGKVLGAAYQGGHLIEIIGINYRGRRNPDGSFGGFYDEVWVNGVRIGYAPGGRPKTPWFFNQSGTKAVHDNTEVSVLISPAGQSISQFKSINPGNGTFDYTADKPAGTWVLNKSGIWSQYRDYNIDAPRLINIVASGFENSILTGSSSAMFSQVSIVYSGSGIATPIVVAGPEGATVGAAYTVTGGVGGCSCVGVWSMSGGVIDQTGHIVSISGCGMGSITYTCGSAYDTLAVRLPSGIWSTVYSGVAQFGAPPSYPLQTPNTGGAGCAGFVWGYYLCGPGPITKISGGVRLTTTWGYYFPAGYPVNYSLSCPPGDNDILVRNLPSGPFATEPNPCGGGVLEADGAIQNQVDHWVCP